MRTYERAQPLVPELEFGNENMAEELAAFSQRRRATFYPKTDVPVPDPVLRSLATEGAAPRPEVPLDLCRLAMGQDALSAHPLPQQGTFHRLYRVALESGAAVIVRFNVVSHWGRDFQLYLDQWAMGLLAKHGLPSLRVYQVDLSRRLCAWDYEIIEEARGTSFVNFDHDESEIRPLLRELGRLAAGIHQIRTERFGWPDVAPLVASPDNAKAAQGLFECWADYIFLNLDQHLQACLDIGAISFGERRRIADIFARLDYVLSNVIPMLLHGDLGNHNVFAQNGAVTALLDWEDCLSGDPLFDVAFWATFHPDDRHKAFLEGYGCERSLPADFELRFWLYYLRIALSKTVHRHRFGYTDHPGRPRASRRIQKALAKVEELS